MVVGALELVTGDELVVDGGWVVVLLAGTVVVVVTMGK